MGEHKIDELFSNLKEYVNLQYDIFRLQLVEKISSLTSNLVTLLLLAFLALMTFLFFSIALALYLSELFHDNFRGFLAVALGYGLITVVYVLFRKSLVRDPLRDKLVKELLEDRPLEKNES